jgi:cytochrome c oxidase subunit 2
MATNPGIPDVEKKVLGASLVFAAAMLGLIAYAALRLGISVPTCVTNVKPFEEGELIRVAPGRYEAHVVAKTWSFKPSRIKVEKGSVIDFYVTSKDIVHGFLIDRTNVNLMAIPGAVNYAQVRFDEAGTHQILCHEFCRAGHDNMTGSIEVTP